MRQDHRVEARSIEKETRASRRPFHMGAGLLIFAAVVLIAAAAAFWFFQNGGFIPDAQAWHCSGKGHCGRPGSVSGAPAGINCPSAGSTASIWCPGGDDLCQTCLGLANCPSDQDQPGYARCHGLTVNVSTGGRVDYNLDPEGAPGTI